MIRRLLLIHIITSSFFFVKAQKNETIISQAKLLIISENKEVKQVGDTSLGIMIKSVLDDTQKELLYSIKKV